MEIVERPWGNYTVLGRKNDLQTKQIIVNPNSRLSLQKHEHRREIWFVIEGSPLIEVDQEKFVGSPGTVVIVEKNEVHRISAAGSKVVIVEVQIGDYLEEDDIIRLEDDYGRIG
jgi:mannose-6-phosphate isomerase-like protein (cupin superfamily)